MSQMGKGQRLNTPDITEKDSWLYQQYVKAVKVVFWIIVVAIFLYCLFTRLLCPSEKDVVNIQSRLFEAEWEQVLENGDKVPVQVPGKVDAAWGETVTLTTVLPETVKNGENLCFHPIWQTVTIYVDGQERLVYDTADTRLFGINSTTKYLFLELSEEDAGKELTYCFSSESKYAGNMQVVRIGDKAGIWMDLFGNTGAKTLISVFLMMMSLFCIIVCAILKVVYKKSLSLIYLAWTIFFCALWMFSENDFAQLIFENLSAESNLTYWSLMMTVFPMVLYIDDVQERYYKKVYILPMIYTELTMIVVTVLQILDIRQFVQMLTYMHIGILTTILCLIVTITIDALTGRLKKYLFVGIGIYGMLFTAILEMVLYYVGATTSLGAVLGLGLLFLLVMAVIKTGQDLFATEKKKQEAIVAREAQAKFLANMSHEMRTPLNAIVGMNEMILRESNNTAVADYANNIQSASNMLLGLINDVLDFSKIESGQLELVEDTYQLPALIQDTVLLMKARSGGKAISTRLDCDSALPSGLRGDELRLKQILTNLISNAIKYTREGCVTLKVYSRELDKEHVELSFSVADTGIGIKKEDIPRLFDSFKRLELNKNRNVQGTGLGLNIVRQLVELMHGTIQVESEYGKGSMFTVTVPQKVVDGRPIGNMEDAIRESRKQKQVRKALFMAPDAQVLVVDDNAVNLALMRGLLKRTGIKVETAKSGTESLELMKEKPYHIIFMDHMMPELDGVETLHLLRQDKANPNHDGIVIALTANAVAGCREMYLGYGFTDYFYKPIQADKLEELLLEYLPPQLIHRTDEQMKE